MHAPRPDGGTYDPGITTLHVRLTRESETYWYAEGVELDYASEGATREAAQTNFEYGLSATIHLNLKRHGHIDGLRLPLRAPLRATAGQTWPQRTDHRFPFEVVYVEVAP